MGFGEEFRSTLGHGNQYRAFGAADRSRLESVVPGYLLELWETDGWAGYRDGLLWMVDPHAYEPIVNAWSLPEEEPVVAVARTAFGALYVFHKYVTKRGEPGGCILKLDPHTGNYTLVGPVAEMFFTQSLAEPQYVETVLCEPDAKRAAADVGYLEWDEMYGYEPALALGGSGRPETVRRYNLFEHHLLLSQLVEAKIQLI